MRDIIINLQEFDIWKIQLTTAINFISSKDTEEEHVIHSRSNYIKFTPYNDVNEIVDELFESLRSRYQSTLEKSMRGSEFIFDSGQQMYYKCHKMNYRCGGSYIDSPDWIENKKAKINQKNKDDKCFQYVVTVALNYVEMK